MMNRRVLQVSVWVTLILCSDRQFAADVEWHEIGDAGSGTSLVQTVSGTPGDNLVRITGTLSSSTDVDVYNFAILNPQAFSASVSAANFDSRLFLFTQFGFPIYWNDDANSDTQNSTLPNAFPVSDADPNTPETIGPSGIGIYSLAITGAGAFPIHQNGPVFPQSSDSTAVVGHLFTSEFLQDWFTIENGGSGAYTITIEGVIFPDEDFQSPEPVPGIPGTIPEPASLLLLAIGLGILKLSKRCHPHVQR